MMRRQPRAYGAFRHFGGVVPRTFYDWLDEVVEPFVNENYGPAASWSQDVETTPLREMYLYLVADLCDAAKNEPVPERPFVES